MKTLSRSTSASTETTKDKEQQEWMSPPLEGFPRTRHLLEGYV